MSDTVTVTNDISSDMYRDIHKGIRGELFAVTSAFGNLDPADECGRAELAARVGRMEVLLASHAHHEDQFVQPLVAQYAPVLAPGVVEEHADLETRFAALTAAATEATTRDDLHWVYLDLSAFTGAYLAHQDVEERRIQPIVAAAVGNEVWFDVHQALVASIPPNEMADSLAIMLPAMNLDDRVELLGGVRAGAPAEVFAGVTALAASVLHPTDMAAVAARLGLA